MISPDGFDWYTEGLYLLNVNSIEQSLKLPILRPPVFVIVTAIVDGPEYNKDFKDKKKYKPYQFVGLKTE